MHGRDATEVHASDLTLDKFIDAATLAAAPSLPGPSAEVRTVLLTGATGFLGRYLALEWLERMDLVDGKVICLVRAKDRRRRPRAPGRDLRQRRPETAARTTANWPPSISRSSPATRARPNLGLDQQTWQRLADTVDLIVDPAALVNHVLPYSQLFGPNALGTAELIRIALTTKLKPFAYVSTDRRGRPDRTRRQFTEDADIRVISADPQGRRQLRQRLRQQQVGRRGAAARGARPVRPAGLGVPLRHDPGRHHLRGSAQPAGHVHPA